MRLKDKVAVITGAANGIGRAIAIRLAREGARVVINDIDKAAGQGLESQIEIDGGTSLYLHGDAASERDVSTLMTAVKNRFGGLDILVNNVTAVPTSEWDSLAEVCLKSYWISMKAAFPLMQHSGSSIVKYIVRQRIDGIRKRACLQQHEGCDFRSVSLNGRGILPARYPNQLHLPGHNRDRRMESALCARSGDGTAALQAVSHR
jgi:3-oxoacyl-[acyl-carrier protein] reductase